MKLTRIFFLAIIAVAVILCLRPRNKTSPPADLNQASAVSSNYPGQVSNLPVVAQLTNKLTRYAPAPNASTSNSYQKPRTLDEWMVQEYSHPISFYGKVVDLADRPISDATVNFQWATSAGKELSVSAVSDGMGLFSLENERGYKLQITVSKSDYYTPKGERLRTFAYGNEGFIAQRDSPVIFHLRKKTAGANLITSQHGMNPDLSFYSPANGLPVFIDFYARNAGSAGQLEVESSKEPKDFSTGQNNWMLRLTVPNGGLVEENDEFPFKAPDVGYQSMVEWKFQDGQTDWRGTINQSFYIKFGSPPVFGRIKINTSAFSQAIFLEYAFNPDGSQNLESETGQ